MSGVGYGSNNNSEVVTRGSHRASCRIIPVPDKHAESPYPVGADSLSQHNSVYAGTVVAIHRGEDTKQVRGLQPVVVDLAGHSTDAASWKQVQEELQPFGVALNDAISNGSTADSMLTAVVKGQLSMLNTGPYPFKPGQKIRVIAPTADSISDFRNNPKHPSLRPIDKHSNKLGMPRGKILLQTVPADDHISVDDLATAGPSSARDVQTLAQGLQLYGQATLASGLLALESEGIITINAPGAARTAARNVFEATYGNVEQGGNDAWVDHVKRVRKGVRESQGPFALRNGDSLVKRSYDTTMARKRRALYMKKKRFGRKEGKRKQLHAVQTSQADAIVSAITNAVRSFDSSIVGMCMQQAGSGDKMEATVDFTR